MATGPGPATAASILSAPTDLTWLLHRAAHRLRAALDEAARAQGLSGGVRDWIVLTALQAGPPRTQLALAQTLGLDKTTVTSLLDRLETVGLIVRNLAPGDRRARIPQITPAGRQLQTAVATERDRVEAELLAGFTDHEQRLLRDLLTRLAADTGPSGAAVEGSCM